MYFRDYPWTVVEIDLQVHRHPLLDRVFQATSHPYLHPLAAANNLNSSTEHLPLSGRTVWTHTYTYMTHTRALNPCLSMLFWDAKERR